MSEITPVGRWAADQVPAAPARPPAGDSTKIKDAAQQFEGLLLAQILHSAHDEKSGWLGSGDDSALSCAGDFAEQQLAMTMAQKGGFGLANMIAAGLRQKDA